MARVLDYSARWVGLEWYIVQPGKWVWSGILFSQVSGTGVVYCSAR